MSDEGKTPDHGSSLFWSTDPAKARKAGAENLLKKNNGNVDSALKDLFSGSCSYESARIYSVLAPDFGLTEAGFMVKYRKWRKGEL